MLLFSWSPLTVKFHCLGRGFLCAAQSSCSHFAWLFIVFKEGSSVLCKAAVDLHRYSFVFEEGSSVLPKLAAVNLHR